MVKENKLEGGYAQTESLWEVFEGKGDFILVVKKIQL